LLGLALDHDPPHYTSQITGMTGTRHHAWHRKFLKKKTPEDPNLGKRHTLLSGPAQCIVTF
jgi:hypothetical protein